MKKMIEVADGFAIMPTAVAVLKRGEEGQSVLFTRGQSALEGFVVDSDYGDMLDEINEALEEENGV